MSLTIPTIAELVQKHGYTTIWKAPLEDATLDIKRGVGRGFKHIFAPGFQLKNGTFAYWNDFSEVVNQLKKGPFFIFLHSYKVHDPYTPLRSSINRFSKKFPRDLDVDIMSLRIRARNLIFMNPSLIFRKPAISILRNIGNDREKFNTYFKKLCSRSELLHLSFGEFLQQLFWQQFDLDNGNDLELVKLLYDAEIYEADQDVKRVFKILKKNRLLDDTIIIITADHGEEFMEHGNIDHGSTLYDEVVHVPLIMRIPGKEARRIPALVQSIDIMPSVLNLLDIPIPNSCQGKNFTPLIDCVQSDIHDFVYSQTFGDLTSIRSMKWKYITDFNHHEELFNIVDDPTEQSNCIERNPDIAKRLRMRLEEFYDDHNANL